MRAVVMTMLVLGCSSSGHELRVDLKTDLVPGVEFHTVRTELLGRGITSRETDLGLGEDLLDGGRVALFDDVRRGSQVLRLTLIDSERRRVQDTILVVDVSSDIGVTVVVSRDCAGVTCPGAGDEASLSACLGGRCVDPRCSVESPDECGSAECASAEDCPEAAPCAAVRCDVGACFYYAHAMSCESGQWCNPDVGCQPLPSDAGADAGVDAPLDASVDAPPDTGTSGAPLAEYRFDEGSGNVVRDSVTPALDLALGPNTRWLAGAIEVMGATTIVSGDASKVIDACRASGALTVEAWITPASTSMDGALFWLGESDSFATVELEQSGSQWAASMDTSLGSGVLEFTGSGTVEATLTHMVLTRFASGELVWYLNDDRRVWTGSLGDFGNWPLDQVLAVSTPHSSGETSFRGTIHYLAVYDRGMSRDEVRTRLAAGPP